MNSIFELYWKQLSAEAEEIALGYGDPSELSEVPLDVYEEGYASCLWARKTWLIRCEMKLWREPWQRVINANE
jgi:hypothetical protein